MPKIISLLFLIFPSFLFAQDDTDIIVFANHKKIVLNIRKVDFKNDLIKVPQIENNEIIIFNYLPSDIDYIATTDSAYVNMIQQKHDRILFLFVYWKEDKMFFYEDKYLERELQKTKLKVSEKKTIKDSIKTQCRKKKLKVLDTTTLNNVLDFRWAVKLSNTLIYEKNKRIIQTYSAPSNSYNTDVEETSKVIFDNYSIAFIKNDKQKNVHEFEIGPVKYFSVEKSQTRTDELRTLLLNGSKVNTFQIGLAYQYQYTFLKKKKSRIIPFIGIAINPTYESSHLYPKISNQYERINYIFGVKTFFIPGIYYFLSKRVFFTASLPINFFYHNHLINYVAVPHLSSDKTTLSSDFSELFPLSTWYFNISVGIKLN